MTRTMFDDLYPLRIPAPQPAGVLIGAYVGHSGNPQSYQQAVDRFPGHQIVSIAAKSHWDAQILDVESGAVEPGDYTTINTWCVRQRDRGVKPTIYANESTWPALFPHIIGAVNWWAANWSNGPFIPHGAVGIQYGSVGASDVSIMLDYIEGIDMSSPSDFWAYPINVPGGTPDTQPAYSIQSSMAQQVSALATANAVTQGKLDDIIKLLSTPGGDGLQSGDTVSLVRVPPTT